MNASTRRLSKSRISFFVDDHAYTSFGLTDPIIVRSELSDDENRARVKAACPWAVVIQRENCGYGAYEDPADADREMRRLEANGVIKQTKTAVSAALKRIRPAK